MHLILSHFRKKIYNVCHIQDFWISLWSYVPFIEVVLCLQVKFNEEGKCYCYFVPGVSEGLLNVLTNEKIIATTADEVEKSFKGTVVDVSIFCD